MDVLKKILVRIFYLPSVFSWSKSFKKNPIIGSYLLNLLGLHVFRVMLSYLFFNLRVLQLFWLINKDERKKFKSDGYLILEDIVSENDVFLLKTISLNDGVGEHIVKEGSTIVERTQLPSKKIEMLQSKKLKRILKYISSTGSYPLTGYEKVLQSKKDDKIKDIQSDWHRDTFHPCIKGWFYFDDVNSDNGCFEYIAESHKLTFKRLIWEYQESLIASKNHDRGYDGSFRIKESLALGMSSSTKTIVCNVPKNTLVIGNVFGFHRRGDVSSKGKEISRSSIWFQARSYPFFVSPLLFASSIRVKVAEFVRKKEYSRKS